MSSDTTIDLEEIRGKAEVSVGLVRKLVSSWLPKETVTSANRHQPTHPPRHRSAKFILFHAAAPGPLPQLYAADPLQTQQSAQLKRRIVGNNGGSSPAVDSPTKTNVASKKREAASDDDDDDDEEDQLHRISMSAKSAKKLPTSTLASYLDKSGGPKKKNKKKKKQKTIASGDAEVVSNSNP
ncbi:hypothetical protein HDU89_007907 [Geranomyces variabilis]|nr:hypothetical protein HDU89_007907 [Geranomyces variabilis]